MLTVLETMAHVSSAQSDTCHGGRVQQLLLPMTGLENAHQSTAAFPFPDKLIPGPRPHPDLDHQLESFFPHLVLALLLKVPAGTSHGGMEGSWRPWFRVSLFQRAGMGLGGLLYWDGAAGPIAHSTYPLSPGFSRQEHWSGLPLPSPKHETEK